MSPNQLRTFFSKAAAYLNNPRFQAAEVTYKLRFQGELRPAMEAYRTGDRHALPQLTLALRSPNQNMIDWRLVQAFLGWCERRASNARTALKSLWFDNGSVEKRFRRFAAELGAAGMSQPGAQLSITSTLLMGLSATQHPPIRTRRFGVVFREAGYPPFQRNQDVTARYAHALRFLDVLIERAPKYGVQLQHRLEAQGVVWCLGGGWKRSVEIGDRTIKSEIDEAEAARLVEEAAHGRQLTETEKKVLVLSRPGQGQFRDELFALWGRCAVTGCRNPELLRASHLKPWRKSTNPQRLDPLNGLLLAPHLDTALDRGLITFTDDGRIQLSSNLSPADCTCLGIRRTMRLSYVDQRHRAYLRFHRQNVFRK